MCSCFALQFQIQIFFSTSGHIYKQFPAESGSEDSGQIILNKRQSLPTGRPPKFFARASFQPLLTGGGVLAVAGRVSMVCRRWWCYVLCMYVMSCAWLRWEEVMWLAVGWVEVSKCDFPILQSSTKYLPRTPPYYKVRLCTTEYNRVILYYIWKCYPVLQSICPTTKYYKVPFRFTKYCEVPQSITLNCKVLPCTAMYYPVLQSITPDYKVSRRTPQYDSALQSITPYCKVLQRKIQSTTPNYKALLRTTKNYSVLQSNIPYSWVLKSQRMKRPVQCTEHP